LIEGSGAGSLHNNYGSGFSRPKNIRIRILNPACELFLTALAFNNVLVKVTVKEATVNTIVAAEVAGWFFIGKNKGDIQKLRYVLSASLSCERD
jgi:hypothetical protein